MCCRRCIKPNPESRPGSLVPEYVLEQLRAGGVLEAVRIACAGFPTRKAFRNFAQRYNLLLSMNGAAYTPLDADNLEEDKAAELCRKILQAVKLQAWQIGKTRVFLRAGQLAQLEVGPAQLESCFYSDADRLQCLGQLINHALQPSELLDSIAVGFFCLWGVAMVAASVSQDSCGMCANTLRPTLPVPAPST